MSSLSVHFVPVIYLHRSPVIVISRLIIKLIGHLSHEDTGTDLLNDLALLALEQKAKVIVVSNGEIPLETGVKSIFRYPEPNRA